MEKITNQQIILIVFGHIIIPNLRNEFSFLNILNLIDFSLLLLIKI